MKTSRTLALVTTACLAFVGCVAPRAEDAEPEARTGDAIMIGGDQCLTLCKTTTACSTRCSRYGVLDSTCGATGICQATCGDGICSLGESACSCNADCPGTCLRGSVTTATVDDVDRCLPNVVGAFSAMNDHGSKLSFWLGAHPDLSYTSPTNNHWQSVQRIRGNGGRYLFLTRSYNGSGRVPMAAIAYLPTRTTTGETFGSNLGPSPADAIVATIWAEISPLGQPFAHAGGSQVVGSFVAVPIEGQGFSRVSFYDLRAPTAPRRMGMLDLTWQLGGRAGVTAITRLDDGRYLTMATNDTKLVFMTTTGTSLEGATWQYRDAWAPADVGLSWPSAYQNMQFLTQCDGKLFIAASWKTGGAVGSALFGGEDWIHVYEVVAGYGSEIRFRRVLEKHMYCDDWCNFDAAAGTYVSPSGKLLYYATEHENSMSLLSTVKMREFAP